MPKKADTKTLANTLRAMLPHIAAGDRWAIAEAADRLEELEGALSGTIGRMMNVAFGLDTTDTKIKAVRDLKKAIAEAQAALATEGKEPLI